MSVFAAALISVLSAVLITWHLSRSTMQRIAGYAFIVDLTMHIGVIYLFMGTSTLGLLQAELSAIFMTLMLRVYRHCYGYQKFKNLRWITYAGTFTAAKETSHVEPSTNV